MTEQAIVVSYSTYCHCKPPRLDKDDLCTLCGTQWVKDAPAPAPGQHTKACLANAMICAVENIRDDPEETDIQFEEALARNYPFEIAQEYLTWRGRNNVLCRCHVALADEA